MNDTAEDNPMSQIMELIIGHGLGSRDQAMTILINEAMKTERAQPLNAAGFFCVQGNPCVYFLRR